MTDLLRALARRIDGDRVELEACVASATSKAVAAAPRDSRPALHRIESHVASRGPAAFRFDPNQFATLRFANRTIRCGRFTTPSIAQLRRDAWRPRRVRLFVLGGTSPILDIGALQAWSGDGTVFQVASQFNALESPGPYVPPISDYYFDPTQGPRASVSAYPGTLLRQYAAPGPRGERFVQESGGRQIDLLQEALGKGFVQDGYLLGEALRARNDSAKEADASIERLASRAERIRVGLHESVEVMLGHDWHGPVPRVRPRIDQVFTSTIAGGQYGAAEVLGRRRFERVAETLLRAAYLGSILSAIALDRDRVVLTLIGGGVFGNPLPLIWRSILWAASECERDNDTRSGMALPERDLDVFVNAREAIDTFRGTRLDRETAEWNDRVSWVEFGSRGRIELQVAKEYDDIHLWSQLRSRPDAASRRQPTAASTRTPRTARTPEEQLASRVPLWIRKAAEATRRDRAGSTRERLARHRARMEHARPAKPGDVSVSWAGDFDAVDLLLQRHYPNQYARDPDRRARNVRLVFGTAANARRSIRSLEARLRRLEQDGVIRAPRVAALETHGRTL